MGKDLLLFYPEYPYMSHNNYDEPHHCGENPNWLYHFEDYYTTHKDQYLFELAPHSLVVPSFDHHIQLECFQNTLFPIFQP